MMMLSTDKYYYCTFNVHLQDEVSKDRQQEGATTSAMKELQSFSGLITCSNINVTYHYTQFHIIGQLNDKDLSLVLNKTWDARSRWYHIGLALGIPTGTLDAVKKRCRDDPDECYTEMLKVWLRGVDPLPTWSALSKVLKSPSVGCGDLAEQLLPLE